jgi:hypothetical protein
MSQTYAQHTLPATREGQAAGVGHVVYSLLGLGIAAIVPSLFWTALIGVVASMLGQPFAGTTLGTIAVLISAFLALIWAALSRRNTSDGKDAA